ncbi:asparagine synthase (glutamine-hydrolyzing) [Haloterrigena sp. SYSU A558-1]|uniref:Putative asparagine synthetase [glutamine-hydrolyzing] n=1 Tax=Haloterrigena gelatinilytica TaxID=2741724 RepID=A0A8J8GIP7_9EURY|nr:asparagine synthase (glutamine-hydrolyzing) [Haloterrigena gelatinilytica]NUB90381.1 asparagine synthase (glutamine-hydrolyzing) [Haloterrigena gelatinilytica]NUC73799.1 asparagine synthase (glutamine-hydrolyzing) [Haloterrigena gelatinilytica]
MCGIVGAYGWTHDETLSSMLDWIEHRGPDEEGSYLDRDAGLMMGARRLSIVDLEGGSQPKWNEDETVGVVFNGEIYNHGELRDRLSREGHRFESECDTEVLVHLWEEYGEEMVSHLEGMFAFSIWDREAETVFLARDRFGIKPLYFGKNDRGYVWGSELPALLIGGVDRTIDPAAVYNHFSLEYTPAPQTLLEDVWKVEPGQSVTITDDGVETRKYWDLLDLETGTRTTSMAAAADRLRTLFERSVEKRLMADVPVGAFLSGGLDSSAVTGIASQLKDEPLKTYSVAFENDMLDESDEARLVADHFGTDHTEVPIDLSSMDLFGEMMQYLGEPTGHLQMLPMYALSERASRDVKVALAGEGADELFAGYPWYQHVPEHKRKVDFMPEFTHDVAGAVAQVAPVGNKHLRYFSGLKNNEEMLLNHVCGFTTFRPEPDEFLRTGESAATSGLRANVGEVTAEVADPSLEQHMSTYETGYTLPDYHLYKADHMSMAQSLELRVPFLSTEMVEFAHSLPAELKVNDDDVKRVLKTAVSDLLPDQILEREKMGMRPPVEDWFEEEHDSIETWFTREKLRQTPYVDANRATALRDAHRRGEESVGRTLWMILTYVAWYHSFIDEQNAVV